MSELRPNPAWSALRLRALHGECLTEEEQAVYEAGLRELQRGEKFPGDIETLLRLRAEIVRLKIENVALKAREAELDRQIAELEARLSPEVRALLRDDLATTVHPAPSNGTAEVERLSEEAVREVDQWERQE
jgi:hypothetical protein